MKAVSCSAPLWRTEVRRLGEKENGVIINVERHPVQRRETKAGSASTEMLIPCDPSSKESDRWSEEDETKEEDKKYAGYAEINHAEMEYECRNHLVDEDNPSQSSSSPESTQSDPSTSLEKRAGAELARGR